MNANPKRAYQKPTIERVNLIGEETTVAGCKQTTGGGKNVSIGNPCFPPTSCKSLNGS